MASSQASKRKCWEPKLSLDRLHQIIAQSVAGILMMTPNLELQEEAKKLLEMDNMNHAEQKIEELVNTCHELNEQMRTVAEVKRVRRK